MSAVMPPADVEMQPQTPPPERQATENDEPDEAERASVKGLMDDYLAARAFDSPLRKQIELDRSYAAGTADQSWAVDANLLGSYIDVLTAHIYAKNPTVSVRPAAQAGNVSNRERQLFSETMQIVITRMWKDGKLKRAMKKVVRSGFSVALGWIKCCVLVDTETDPEVEHALNDARDNMARVMALMEQIADPNSEGYGDADKQKADLQLTIEGLEANIEVVLRKGLAIDFVSAEHMQCSLDVRDIEDYLQAGWLGNEFYIQKQDACAVFPMLTPEDVKRAKTYFQRTPAAFASATHRSIFDVNQDAREAYQYTTETPTTGTTIQNMSGKPVEFIRAIEIWDRRDNHIKSLVEGLDKWPRDPFVPKYATSRFYPYFLVAFYAVDGDRAPQSLSYRLAKLQDEYASNRSNYRLTRERSIPGIFFNSTGLPPSDVQKIKDGVQGEFIGLAPTDPDVDLRTLFAGKPVPEIDPLLFDTSKVIGDMEKISGVQEALQSSQTMNKTATQAEIEQSGFNARTGADRDTVEDMLADLANYTAQLAIQCLTYQEVIKIAGPLSFWPEGLPLEDVTTLLDVEIVAGSTGRPNSAAERQAWAQMLPLIRETMVLAMQARAAGNEPLAQSYIELVRETLRRFDDRIDIDRFIPNQPAITPGVTPGAPTAPGAPPMPGQGLPPEAANDPAMPPDAVAA